MKKSKPISFNTVIKNKKLGEFIKEEVDKTKEVFKLTWDTVIKWTKKTK